MPDPPDAGTGWEYMWDGGRRRRGSGASRPDQPAGDTDCKRSDRCGTVSLERGMGKFKCREEECIFLCARGKLYPGQAAAGVLTGGPVCHAASEYRNIQNHQRRNYKNCCRKLQALINLILSSASS